MATNWGVPSGDHATGDWGSTGTKQGTVASAGGIAPATAPTDLLSQLTNTTDRNAFSILQETLGQWDLESLAPQVLKFIQQGWQSDAITSVLLPNTKEYQDRFAGNATRIKNGLAPLSPAEYISTERAYRQVLAGSGLPSTFYDDKSDYAGLIGSDISAQELQTRTADAFRYVNTAIDPAVTQAWQDYYGVDKAHMAAHFLDPNAAQASLDRQSTAVDIATAALRNGLQETSQSRAEAFADQGVTGDTAKTAYGNLAQTFDATSQEANRFGEQYTQADAEDEYLGGLASAQRKRTALNSQESALWAANSPNTGPPLGGNTGGAW